MILTQTLLLFLMMFSTTSPPRLHILWFQTPIPYQTAWEIQRSLFEARRAAPQLEDVLLLLEHPPVYTLGRGADAKFLQFNPEVSGREVYRVGRGGEVTYHCPGQLVGYPILNLKRHQPDLHDYLRRLEGSLIAVLAHWGLSGSRLPGLTGFGWRGPRWRPLAFRSAAGLPVMALLSMSAQIYKDFVKLSPVALAIALWGVYGSGYPRLPCLRLSQS